MDLGIKKDKGVPRTITPFPENPEVRITMRAIPQNEIFAIWDKVGVRPNSEKNTWGQYNRANREIIIRSIVSWEGFQNDGQDFACSDENKVKLLEKFYPDPADSTKQLSAWQIIQKLFDDEEAADVKN